MKQIFTPNEYTKKYKLDMPWLHYNTGKRYNWYMSLGPTAVWLPLYKMFYLERCYLKSDNKRHWHTALKNIEMLDYKQTNNGTFCELARIYGVSKPRANMACREVISDISRMVVFREREIKDINYLLEILSMEII